MEITTVKQFIKAVTDMRAAQKKAKKCYSSENVANAESLEHIVDKAISEREKRLFEEENTAQGRLF